MKKILSLLLCTACLFPAALSCGSPDAGDKVVIYAEYNGKLGTYDAEVKAAIEEKFERDTGLSIDLSVEAVSTGDAGNKMGQAMASGSSTQLDAFVYHYASDSILNGYILDEACMDLTPYMDTAPAFFRYHNDDVYDPSGLSYYSGVYQNKLYALSSQEYTSGWGMLVRRDHMANTSYDPDEYDIANPDCKSLSVQEFYDLLTQLKANNEGVNRPFIAMSWEADELLGPAFGSVGYGQKMMDEDGNIIPSYADESYLRLMEFERKLQLEKLWIENPSATRVDLKQYFASGKGSVYAEWPEVTSQATLAAEMKSETGVDCIMLAPLKAEGSEQTNGNLRRSYAFKGLMVPYKAQNAELLMQFMNWLYADVENYELAKYGIKGEHWVEGETKTVGDRSYSTWAYPKGREAEFAAAKPYSGIYCLIESIHLSNRIYEAYTDQQVAWIDGIRNGPSFPADQYVTEGILLPTIPATERDLRRYDRAHGLEYIGVRKYAWSDAEIPEGQSLESLFRDMKNNLYGEYYPLLEFYTENYNAIMAERKGK